MNAKFLTAVFAAAATSIASLPAWAVEADLFDPGSSGNVFATAVPEPASLTLLAAGIAGIAFARRRR